MRLINEIELLKSPAGMGDNEMSNNGSGLVYEAAAQPGNLYMLKLLIINCLPFSANKVNHTEEMSCRTGQHRDRADL